MLYNPLSREQTEKKARHYKYVPVSEQKLREMSPEERRAQYVLLIDLLEESMQINFEREPEISDEELIETILETQKMQRAVICRANLAEILRESGKKQQGQVIY